MEHETKISAFLDITFWWGETDNSNIHNKCVCVHTYTHICVVSYMEYVLWKERKS